MKMLNKHRLDNMCASLEPPMNLLILYCPTVQNFKIFNYEKNAVCNFCYKHVFTNDVDADVLEALFKLGGLGSIKKYLQIA